MADIELLDLVEFLEFGKVGEVVVREYEYFKIGELGHEGELFNFEIGKVGKL